MYRQAGLSRCVTVRVIKRTSFQPTLGTLSSSSSRAKRSFEVPEASIFGYLGPNGAGKTTTIKTLMNIFVASSGSATVLGLDSRRLSPTRLQQIGYVSENQEIPGWMSVDMVLLQVGCYEKCCELELR
jgi:ABC-type multidrug transport system ATPase subunit